MVLDVLLLERVEKEILPRSSQARMLNVFFFCFMPNLFVMKYDLENHLCSSYDVCKKKHYIMSFMKLL